jgi:peptidyl-tRNA hydrolase, PTH1 family
MKQKDKARFLIVGLGNPDQEYAFTLHNVGYITVSQIAETQGIVWKKSKTVWSEVTKFDSKGSEVILLKPQTYMNKSGLAVSCALKFWKIRRENMLVVQDDSDLPIGRMKIGFNQSSGGHKGLDSINRSIGGQKFARLKIGVRPVELPQGGNAHVKAEKFILRPYPQKALEKIAQAGADVVQFWLENGLSQTMSKYNNKDYKYSL